MTINPMPAPKDRRVLLWLDTSGWRIGRWRDDLDAIKKKPHPHFRIEGWSVTASRHAHPSFWAGLHGDPS